MTRKYTISIKKQINNFKQIKFDQIIEIVTLRNQGWSIAKIAKKLNLSRQRVHVLYKKGSEMKIEEIERIKKLIGEI